MTIHQRHIIQSSWLFLAMLKLFTRSRGYWLDPSIMKFPRASLMSQL